MSIFVHLPRPRTVSPLQGGPRPLDIVTLTRGGMSPRGATDLLRLAPREAAKRVLALRG